MAEAALAEAALAEAAREAAEADAAFNVTQRAEQYSLSVIFGKSSPQKESFFFADSGCRKAKMRYGKSSDDFQSGSPDVVPAGTASSFCALRLHAG